MIVSYDSYRIYPFVFKQSPTIRKACGACLASVLWCRKLERSSSWKEASGKNGDLYSPENLNKTICLKSS